MGLDAVRLPSEVTVGKLARIMDDAASLVGKLHKPLLARLLLVAGKKAGERAEFLDLRPINATLPPLAELAAKGTLGRRSA